MVKQVLSKLLSILDLEKEGVRVSPTPELNTKFEGASTPTQDYPHFSH